MEKQFLKLTLGLLLSLALIGCGKGEEDVAGAQVGIEDGHNLNESTLSKTETGLEGTGAWRFARNLASKTSRNAVLLRDVNLLAIGSKVEIVFFSSEERLTNGLRLTLYRAADHSVGATIDINNSNTRTVIPARLANLNANNFSVVIDFLGMDGLNPRILMYPFPDPVVTNFYFDTNRMGDLNASIVPTALPGIFAGAILTNSKIGTIRSREAVSQ